MTPHAQLPPAITPFSRDQILSYYPAAQGDSPEALVHRRWLEALFSSRWMDDDSDGIVLPYYRVAQLDGVHPHAHGFDSGRRLREIDRELIPLKVRTYDRHAGRARVVWPEVPSGVQAIWDMELACTKPNEYIQRVDFVTGAPISRRGRQAELHDYADALRLNVRAPEGHPGLRLQSYLNDQPQQSLTRLVKTNWESACEATLALPVGAGKRLAIGTMLHLAEQQHLVYNTVKGSHRLFAMGVNLTQLPRDVRRKLLRGTWQHDLASAQLAVVARVWGIPLLLDFLEESDGSFWTVLLESVGLNDDYKPVLKRAVYRIIFGGRRDRAKLELARGNSLDPGVGKEKAEALLQHPLIVALLAARERALEEIGRAGGVKDAFGAWHPLPNKTAKARRSLLALQAQSYEQRIMLELVPVLQAEPKTRVAVWLHDGLYTVGPEPERVTARMQRAVNSAAWGMNIPTTLESKRVN